jgi:EpsI family protein
MLAVGLVCYFPAGRMHLAVLVASALVIACLVNIARILAMALYPESEDSATHALQGALLFLVGSAAVCVVDVLLRRREDGGPPARGNPGAGTPPSRHAAKVEHLAALAILLGLMLGASIWAPRWTPPEPPESSRIPLGRTIGDWEGVKALKPSWRYLGSVRFRKTHYRQYQRGDETVSVFVGYDDRLDRSRSILSPKHALPGAGWHVEEREPVALEPGGLRVESVSARSGSNRILSQHWYEGTDPLFLEILRAWLATDQSPLRRPGGAWVVRLSTDLASTREERREAEARLSGFAELLLPRLPFSEEAT